MAEHPLWESQGRRPAALTPTSPDIPVAALAAANLAALDVALVVVALATVAVVPPIVGLKQKPPPRVD